MQEKITGIVELVILAKGQSNIAKALGISPQAVQQWVKQGYVPLDRSIELEKLYNVPKERLISPKHLT
jgi:DNA-binding transcriptional regulator YdaS (Cro superfamily)